MWIRVMQSLPGHAKTIKASRRLGIKRVELVGHLVCLWLWSMDNAPGGHIKHFSPEVLADVAYWDGDADLFCNVLLEVGFLDKNENGAVCIHDWQEYGGKLEQKREQNRERLQRYREKQKQAEKPDGNETPKKRKRSALQSLPEERRGEERRIEENREEENKDNVTQGQSLAPSTFGQEENALVTPDLPSCLLEFTSAIGAKRFPSKGNKKLYRDLIADVGEIAFKVAAKWAVGKGFGLTNYQSIASYARKVADNGPPKAKQEPTPGMGAVTVLEPSAAVAERLEAAKRERGNGTARTGIRERLATMANGN